MREEDSNWFSKYEDQLPSPNELISLSQTLIPPNLASAFNIQIHGGNNGGAISLHHSPPPFPPPLHHPNSSEFDSSSTELGCVEAGGGACSSEEPARTLKRPRLVWTPQLHKRFVDAVAQLGIKNAVPKTIMQLMSVDGLTRENVASHLQKYRLYLKRIQTLNGPGCGPSGSGDPVADRLFASSPVPAHFLQQVGGGPGGPECFGPYVTGLGHQDQIQAQYQNNYVQMGRFGLGRGDGLFEHPFLSRQAHLGPVRNGIMVQNNNSNNNNSGFVEDLESGIVNKGRKVLTLFPTEDD